MGLPAAALLYAAITALLFRHLLPDVTTHLYSDLGDPLLNTSILAWNAARLPLTSDWWNFPSYAPLSGVTAFTEHLLLTYPVASPVIWITGNPVLAYNVVFLAAMPLNGLAAFALARELLLHGVPLAPDRGSAGDSAGAGAAALVAGLAFAFAPYQSVHLSHLQHMTAWGMPFALLWLHRYLRTGRRSALAWFGVGWLAATLANSALLVFVPLLVLLWSVWFVRPHEWKRLVGPAVAAAVATLPLLPLLWGYHVRQAAHGLTRTSGEIQSFSADMIGLAGMYHRAAAWDGVLSHDFEEGALFPGLTTLALALVAVMTALRHKSQVTSHKSQDPRHNATAWSRRLLRGAAILTLIVLARVWTGPWSWHIGPLPLPPFRPYRLFTVAAVLLIAGVLLTRTCRRAWSQRDAVVFYAVAVVAMWLLALGPEPEWSTPWRALIYGPYRLLVELPGLQSVRVPARAWFAATLGLAVLAGCGTAVLVRRYARHARTMVAALALLIVAEGWFTDRTIGVPPPMRQAAIPRGALVLDLPMDEGFQNAVPQYRAVVGGYRTINGYSGYQPAHVYPLRRAIADLHAGALDAYRRQAELYVIIRADVEPPVARWIASHPGAEHLFDLNAATVYRLPRLR